MDQEPGKKIVSAEDQQESFSDLRRRVFIQLVTLETKLGSLKNKLDDMKMFQKKEGESKENRKMIEEIEKKIAPIKDILN